MNQASNALGMGGMGSGMNIHSQNQGLNLQALTGDSEQGRRQALQRCVCPVPFDSRHLLIRRSMLQSGALTAQQQQSMFPGLPQQNQQQFNPSPNQQNAQMTLPPNMQSGGNGNNGGQNLDFSAQQLEQFFRQNPGFDKGGDRNQAIQQLMQKVRQGGINMNAPSGQGQQQQQQQQRQQPHAVGLNVYAGQQGQNAIAQQQQHQRQMSGQPNQQQMPPQQQQQQQQMQQRIPNDQQFNLAAQQFQNANMGNDAQRQIEAVSQFSSHSIQQQTVNSTDY